MYTHLVFQGRDMFKHLAFQRLTYALSKEKYIIPILRINDQKQWRNELKLNSANLAYANTDPRNFTKS